MTDELPLPRHGEDATKVDRGSVLVVGGSRATPGAVLLAGLAALRVGAGRLQLATVESVATSLGVAVPESLVRGLPETADGDLSDGGADAVGELAAGCDAVLLGPGVRDGEAMDRLLAAILEHTDGIVVVDAGALPALGRHGPTGVTVIATPNESELDVLGPTPSAAAASLGLTIASRGAETTVAAPDGRTWTVAGGGVGLGTSGSGDVAAGAVAGLAAQAVPPEAAAVWGVRLHALAGERLGGIGFLARELLDVLPAVLAEHR